MRSASEHSSSDVKMRDRERTMLGRNVAIKMWNSCCPFSWGECVAIFMILDRAWGCAERSEVRSGSVGFALFYHLFYHKAQE